MSYKRPAFVEDLIPLILEATEQWWTQDYLRLALVSPAWLFYVRRRLYAHPSIRSFESGSKLVRTFQENPGLLQLLSGIELQPTTSSESRCIALAQHMASIYCLLALEGLKRVKLGGELTRHAERFLNSLAFADQVEELVVDGTLLQGAVMPAASLEWDESMFYRFHNLKTLKLINLDLDIFPSPPAPFVPITRLILHSVEIVDGFLSQMVHGASLKLVDIAAKSPAEYDEQVRLVLEVCEVDELRYNLETPRRGDRPFLDLDRDDPLSMRCLQLSGHAFDGGLLTAIVQHCGKLEDLVVAGRSSSVTSEDWANFINSRAIPSLTRLSLPGGTHLPPYTKWSPLQLHSIREAAASHSIVLLH